MRTSCAPVCAGRGEASFRTFNHPGTDWGYHRHFTHREWVVAIEWQAVSESNMWASIWRWFRFSTPLPLGARGEEAAARYLRRLGYRIIARQAREQRGELDLIALDGRVIVFVEVKTRSSTNFGHPADAVDLQKQRRITRAAFAFLRRHRLLENPFRFDVVAIIWPAEAKRPFIQHYRHAFESPERWQFFG